MLIHTIKTDVKEAMKAKDSIRLETLRGALSAFTNELVAKGKKPTEEITDEEVLVVLKRLSKQRKDSAEQFEKGGRPELAQKELLELRVIEAYLPASVSKEDIRKVALEKKASLGVSDASGIGKLTGAVMKEFGGSADGNDVKEVVASLFA